MYNKLKESIDLLKTKRGFNVEEYIKLKVNAINKFFEDNELDSCVIGVSGGIDSAVVLKLLTEAANLLNSPIKRVVPLIMPIYCNGTSGQNISTEHGLSLLRSCDYTDPMNYVFDLSNVLKSYIQLSLGENDWAVGQLASIVRTPFVYYQAAQLQAQGYKSIVVGTTNRDEGSYIGFFGKASDAMVDLQPIADIHKSEVYQVAEYLNVPESIINRKPQGDVYDGKCDEEMIGAPYWFLEYHLLLKCIDPLSRFTMKQYEYILTKEEKRTLIQYIINIENLHNKNLHKYKVGLPSHFIDVMERHVPGGW